MAKYSEDELKIMAKTVCEDFTRGGSRSMHLCMIVSEITGLSPNEVRRKIQTMADDQDD